ncbi:thiol:disulfide interchange protein DsbD [Granulicella pectinivorans]|jgi:thiol:disulfide interchange protein DsbD|uniref:Thiol:disulfide interchange protein DsbD n=1 Tax=Granulicella pectinivorans TaxID=474950 RepID=A0A1I6N115_9BACT|nr:thioredoxin family protein [Granulicella pectinivorans]SFS21636.1 thiol:disulfide interchange protein DsbD [Granulicella pectinivorans]
MFSLRRLTSSFFPAVLLAIATVSGRAQLVTVGDGGPGPVKAQHLTAELTTLAPSVNPGGTLQAGLVLTLEEKWHVYWANAGDSGQPPKITWTLPEGVTAGPLQFPAPSRLPLGPLMDFGYEDLVAFPLTISVAKDVKPGPIHLDAMVNWLVCSSTCIPGKAHLGLNLTVVAQPTPEPARVGALGTALTLLPTVLPATAKYSVMGGAKDYVVTLLTTEKTSNAEFYPYEQDQICNAAEQTLTKIPGGVQIRVPRAAATDAPVGTECTKTDKLAPLAKTLHGVLKLSDKIAYDVTGPVVPGEVAVTVGQGGAASGITIPVAIGLAFLGGIILNLMPCVFPVLFLKGLALVQSSTSERKQLRMHGVVYTLGILVSFWTIVAALLIVRAGGSQAGWGFQLQSPIFIALLALGLFFFSLSLAGQFDLGLSLTSVGGGLAKKEGYAGSFFTGVLATIVATPCTAPLMGAAIGFALAQSAGVTFAVFTALGLGLAVPYLALSFQPAWTKILPRPGAWMEVLKQLTSVPLFITVAWLLWVYGNLFASSTVPSNGVDHESLLLLSLILLAIAGWALGRWPAKLKSSVTAFVLGAIAVAIPLYQPKDTTLVWAPYTTQAVADARAEGKPVFIDFTAAWCLSCQVNEKLVLKSAEVQKVLADKHVTLIRADWTQYDPAITRELAAVDRSGVPTYVIYPAGKDTKADVLPEVLTKQLVLDALAKDTKQ